MKLKFFTAFASTLILGAVCASAQGIIDPGFGGNAVNSQWTNLTQAQNPGTGSGAWTTTITSNVNSGSSTVAIRKASGTALASSVAESPYLYSGPFGANGELRFESSNPIADLSNLSFQYRLVGEPTSVGSIIDPVVYINGSATALSVTYSNIIFEGDFEDPDFGAAYFQTALFQWDLSGIEEEITSFSIGWSNLPLHLQIYEFRVDQSDVYSQAIPEPSTYALLIGGVAGAAWLRRRRKVS